jgi:signal transduction histidine kinase
LSLCILFLFVAIAAVALLRNFATEQMVEENAPGVETARVIASALSNALAAAPDPSATLNSFVTSLNAGGTAVTFRAPDGSIPGAPATLPGSEHRAPNWFVRFLAMPPLVERYPIAVKGHALGEIVFEPTLQAEVHEKWIGFLAIMSAGLGLAAVTVIIAYWTIGNALRPLRDLGLGLARLRNGDYTRPIVCRGGPPEIVLSCAAANDLASKLDAVHRENRSLLRKMVSIQDDERRDIARELHDELGPLLFAIRANATAFLDSMPETDGDNPAERVIQSVEALQSTNRRILDRLRPHYIEELGVTASIEALIRNVRTQQPSLTVTSEISPKVTDVDRVVAQTIYRVLQESLTNVLRHAQASQLTLRVTVLSDHATIEVSDNGVGLQGGFAMGRGLTGMRERVRALGGQFEISRVDQATVVRCDLPIAASDEHD